MVLPRFIAQALAGEDVTAYGDGKQTRCFVHVTDVVRALLLLFEDDGAVGRVFNVGATREVSIRALAERVIARAGSRSHIRFVPYDAYGPGFAELVRRQPESPPWRT